MNLFLAAAAARFSDGYMGRMTGNVYKVYDKFIKMAYFELSNEM